MVLNIWTFTLLYWIIFLCTQVQAFYDDLSPVKVTLDVWHPRKTRVADATSDLLNCEKPNIYICEEPPNAISPDTSATCNYRNTEFQEQVYRWVAGRGCLLYTPDFLYVAGVNTINLNSGCFYGNWFAPCLEIAKEDGTCGCYPFDPGLEEVAVVVREALIPSAQDRWYRCFEAASQCCSNYMENEMETSLNSGCKTTFDGWTCWHPAEIDTTAQEVCPEFAYSNNGPSCHHYSNKRCFTNGTWELQTDYSTCSVAPRLLQRYRFHIAVLSISVAFCLPAVIVFFMYKRLRITRVILHRNLLCAVILRNLLVIISRSAIYMDELTNSDDTVMSTHGWWCMALAIAERIAVNVVFVCMLIEGVYLHRLIVAVFRKKLNIKVLYCSGAVIAILPVAAWSVMMGLHDNHSCWLVYTVSHVQWILDAPRLLILLVNTVLFVDVLRVLLTKIRNSENANQLSTTKATLFLMPLFGTQFLLTAIRPSTTNCVGEQIYYYVTYTVEGLQGFIIAVIYCYLNKEVHMLVKETYRKTENALTSRVQRDSHNNASTASTGRRMTYSTNLPEQPNASKDQYSSITRKSLPKLHVAEIISIQASERLADILEPAYETIDNGYINAGYDSLNRPDLDKYTDYLRNINKLEEYYGFTNASSISIDCQDWIRNLSSPSSSVCNGSLNENPSEFEVQNKDENKKKKNKEVHSIDNANSRSEPTNDMSVNLQDKRTRENEINDDLEVILPETEEDKNMIEEIMKYIENNENKDVVRLDSEKLAPNRKKEEKIIFVDE